MKPLLFFVVLLISTTVHGMFGHVAQEKERRQHAEEQLQQREAANTRLHITVSVLSAGVIAALIIGCSMGNKAKRDDE